MPRLFTALEIPAEIGQSLAALRGGLPGARWVDPENYHLTLRFIGDIDDVLAHEIAFMLSNVRRSGFELRFDGLHSFGGRKPRAVVATVAPTPQIYELQAEQERLMQRVASRSGRRRSASRASCSIRRAPRSAAGPMWSRRPIRSRPSWRASRTADNKIANSE